MRTSTRIAAALAGLLTFSNFGGTANASEPNELSAKKWADPSEYLADIKTELKKCWPHNRTVVIACHGHSVPTGYFRTPEVRPFESYPHLMHVQLRRLYPTSVTSVICTGVGGETSEQGARRFKLDVLAKKPDVVTIDYSLNDRGIGLERARLAWTQMIEQSKAAGVKIILLTPTADLRADMLNPDDPLSQHAAQVRLLAAEYNTGLADSFAAFQSHAKTDKPLEELMSQPNHPNTAGHHLVVTELIKWFEL